MSDFKIVKLVDPIVVQTNGVNASIDGHTAGVPAVISSGTMVLSGGNNITLSQNGQTVEIQGGAGGGGGGGVAQSAGTQLATSGTVKFANSNGITFGMSNSSQITATVRTDYQSSGNYLTTARASNDGVGLNTAKTNVTWTVNSSGISLDGGAYLTTARASNDAVGLNTAQTNVTWTVNSSGISIDGGAYLTTAQPVGAYLTTARASNDAIGLNTAKTNVTWTVNSSGISLDAGAYLTTAQPVGAYLTTARASNDAIGLNTAKTNVTWTVNSSGISLDAGAYLTTAAASNHSHGNPTLALTNLTGTTASASNGLTLSLSGNAAQTVQTQNLHNVSLSGNTAGVMAQISSGVMTLAGGNNVTLSQNGNAVTISGGAAGGADGINALVVNGGASTASTTLALSNANNVTFGHNAGTITASASFPSQTNQNISLYALGNTTQNSSTVLNASNLSFNAIGSITAGYSNGSIQLSAPNALTTAMASNRGTDFVQANAVFNGTNASGTIASNAISISVAAPGSGAALKGSGAQTQNTGTVEFANSNGITFGLSNNGTMTASHNGLTTARASNDAIGLNTAKTNVTWTVNSSGISLDAAAYLTTAQPVGAYLTTARASNDAIGLNTAKTNVTWTVNSSGISLDAGAYLTTAMASNAATISNINFSAGTTSLNLSKLTFADSNGISFGLSGNSVVTGTVKTDYQSSNANYLTSQSSQAVSNSAGSFTFQTLNFSNANNVTWGTSAGGIVTASVAAPGGSNTPAVSNSAGSFTFSTLNFSNANNVTWGTSAGGIVTASVAAPGAAAENNWFNLVGANTAGNTTASGSTIALSGINATLSGTNGSAINISVPATSSLSATGQVSLSTNGSTISIGVPGALTVSRYNEFKESPLVGGEIGNASLHLQPWLIPNLHMDRVVLHKVFSNATNSSFSFTVSDWVGLYTKNGGTLSLLASTSAGTNFSGSGTAGSYLSYGGGIKAVTIGMTNTLTEGMYWVGVIQRSTTGGGAGHTLQQALNSNMNSTYRGLMGVATNATNQMSAGFGAYTATTSAMPASIAFTEINGNSSVYLRPPSVYFVSGTV